jgi:hypothetical protein
MSGMYAPNPEWLWQSASERDAVSGFSKCIAACRRDGFIVQSEFPRGSVAQADLSTLERGRCPVGRR